MLSRLTPHSLAEKFGTAFALVKVDVGGNIDRLGAAQHKDPAKYHRVFDIITDEVSRGEQEGKSSDTNGLLWLMRCADARTAPARAHAHSGC